MPAQGKHRRTRTISLRRGLAAVTTGGAVLALPVIGATSAFAAPTPAAPQAAPAPAAVSAQANSAAQAAPAQHSVKAGETLSKIAREHSVSGGWEKLYEGNRKIVGENPDLIHPGIKLTLGAASAKASDGKAAKASPSAARGAAADRADRSERIAAAPVANAAPAAEKQAVAYTNDLDGWIKESLAIMAEQGIPGTYEGIHRNIMRESSGNPAAINNWDSNAVKGTPSKGLLQVIDPTFQAYHVPGTSTDSYDPVANITAACNYAADRYGSIDNVFGAY
ncbi:LysM peptidoglycan-binding domain-containing protein [Streptomyces californicus]|uniref:LysM peptidoglycan-binding domain-containing protein n=2 Tax=Streptomyces TaxID=1883 RepID=A0ABD7CRB5_9ACTN|nr:MULTISPECIES: LysM peptidoglycan-binding domain-containing protein [Streptomyces]QRV31634.1 LysM peptidoglycan-binding domain-containing protein [Streptomyces californicus]QRV32755.1 LysM peptidoglycan-binding domain-containing protein [Streptomyces californicus]QRV45051.1 LysM peptidoglycan-binding domain-containing protein [Streptomyces californicus]QRV51741.1 LysM peptidoglycan-binding domain-containing protein [Streptomyces californicus]